MRVDADGHEADDVFVDAGLALELGDRRRRGIDVEHDVMRLAVLGDAVGEAAQAPGFGLDDLAAVVGEDLGGVFRERVDLGLGQILTREENMLVKRHASSLCWPIADAAPCERPSGCRLKSMRAAETSPVARAAPMAKAGAKGKTTREPWHRCKPAAYELAVVDATDRGSKKLSDRCGLAGERSCRGAGPTRRGPEPGDHGGQSARPLSEAQANARRTPQFKRCMNSGDAARGVTMGMNNCLGAETKRQDAKLNATYRRIMARQSTRGKTRLQMLQRAWIPERDATCKRASDEARGGTLSTILFSDCIITETIRRTAWLERYRG